MIAKHDLRRRYWRWNLKDEKESNTGRWGILYGKSKCPETETSSGLFQNHCGWRIRNGAGGGGAVMRDGVDKQARARSEQLLEYGKDGVRLPSWNFFSLPTARLSRHHHQLSPKVSSQWYLGSNRWPWLSIENSQCLWPHPCESGQEPMPCMFWSNPIPTKLCCRFHCLKLSLHFTLIRLPDFTRLKPSAARKRDA